MRDELVTAFWRKAYRGLPEHVRGRYHGEFVTAERMELAVAGLVELWTRARDAVAGKEGFCQVIQAASPSEQIRKPPPPPLA